MISIKNYHPKIRVITQMLQYHNKVTDSSECSRGDVLQTAGAHQCVVVLMNQWTWECWISDCVFPVAGSPAEHPELELEGR